jgi:uracil-DNA glycosylase family 4
MDARDQLRRYLEQRREMGERELVLDGMSVEDVMRILDARAPSSPEPERAGPSSVSGGAPARSSASAAPVDSSDWREVLRSTGSSPAKAPERPSERAAPASPPAPAAAPAETPPPVPPASAGGAAPTASPGQGLVVGTSSRELFGGPLSTLQTIDDIAAAVTSCTRCPLYKTALNPVPGEGSATAELVCVGEAPGQTEDETGRPFVGAAGQLLTKILAAINLRREDVFICNVLKHRPPMNRNPMPQEVEACSPYLVRQLEIIRPKVIVAFGTFAAQTLLDTKLSIGKLRGIVHRYYGIPLVVTYHPAALLRNPAWKRPTWEDVQLARRVLDRAPGA